MSARLIQSVTFRPGAVTVSWIDREDLRENAVIVKQLELEAIPALIDEINAVEAAAQDLIAEALEEIQTMPTALVAPQEETSDDED